MPLDDALAGVTVLAIDTAPFIYLIERHPVYLDRVRAVFERVDSGVIQGYCSTLTLTEVLTRPYQVGDMDLINTYRRLLRSSRHLTLLPISADIADRAADLRARYRLRTPDALQLASALVAGCQAFLTNDRALSRVVDLSVLVLDDLTV